MICFSTDQADEFVKRSLSKIHIEALHIFKLISCYALWNSLNFETTHSPPFIVNLQKAHPSQSDFGMLLSHPLSWNDSWCQQLLIPYLCTLCSLTDTKQFVNKIYQLHFSFFFNFSYTVARFQSSSLNYRVKTWMN